MWTIMSSKWRSPLLMTESCHTPFRVWFTDLDVLMHMNNGKYFSLMDLARVDLMSRAGAFRTLSKKGIYPVVASETIKFKKSLKLFQAFTIKTQVIGWDERNFFLEQQFLSQKRLVSLAYVKAQFLRKNGNKVSTKEIFESLNEEDLGTKPPSYVEHWDTAIEQAYKSKS
jgi:YbgC/YbaW family acyl-CoA thioester hydrolase